MECDTDVRMVEALKQCEDKHGFCTPKVFTDMDTEYSVSEIIREFGSWSSARDAAELENDYHEGTPGRDRVYSDADILDHIRECARRNDGRCTVSLLKEEDDLVRPSVAFERFGSWLNAKKQAGIESSQFGDNHGRPRTYSDEDYYELLYECYKKHGKVTKKLFDEESKKTEGHPTSGAVRKRFKNWNNAKSQMTDHFGIEIDDSRSEFETEELLEMLRECKRRHGRASANVFASDDDFCSPETLQRRFGSWTEAKEMAGVQ